MQPNADTLRLIGMDELVRPGRECKECGENRRGEMAPQAKSVDGHRLWCRVCWRDKVRATEARWRAEHPESTKVAQSRWEAANRGHQQRWREANRDKDRKAALRSQSARRARLAEATCTPARNPWASPVGCEHAGPYDIDHIVPIKRGGCAHEHNLQLLCAECNRDKWYHLPVPGTGCPEFWTPRSGASIA